MKREQPEGGTTFDHFAQAATVLAGLSAVAVATVVVGDFMIRTRGADLDPTSPRPVANWEVIQQARHRLGSPNAAVTIVEFGDYECPLCRSWVPHIAAILAKYPEEVAFVYRHWPLPYHEHAYRAAQASECAGAQGRFWEYHDLLYSRDDWYDHAAQVAFASAVEVPDIVAFERCLEEEPPNPVIEEDIAAVREAGGRGTPTIIVNGFLIAERDSLSLEALVQEARR